MFLTIVVEVETARYSPSAGRQTASWRIAALRVVELALVGGAHPCGCSQ